MDMLLQLLPPVTYDRRDPDHEMSAVKSMNNQSFSSQEWDSNVQRAAEIDGFHLDLERYWIEARSQRYWLGGILLAALLAGLIVTLLSTELYRANTRIEVSQITANVTAIDPLENESPVSETSVPEYAV